MYAKLPIFMLITSVLMLAIFSSIMNFVSAVKGVECFGGSKIDHYFCVLTNDDGTIIVSECIRNEEGLSECTQLNSKPTPSGIEQSIQDTVKEEAQTNTNDPKDLGGMRSDKGTTKSPIE